MTVSVSIVIPTYNRAALVTQAIDSVLQQEYADREIIVVDDGSTDGTESRLASYGSALTYVRQPNRGVNAARNHGIAVSRGRYVALLDDDDLWLDGKLGEQIRLLDVHSEAGFVFSDFYILKGATERRAHGLHTWHEESPDWPRLFARYDQVETAGALPGERKRYGVYTGDIYKASLTAPYVLPSTAVIRRSAIEPDLRLNESDPTCGDWEFFARLSHRHGAVFMDIETALNRSHEDAVRLTRLPRKIQLARRVGMVRRVWRADTEFYRENSGLVDRVELGLLRDLAMQSALDGDAPTARSAVRERRLLRGTDLLSDRLLAALLWLPGGTRLLRVARQARHLLARLGGG